MAGISDSGADEANKNDDDFHVSGVLRDDNYKNWVKAAEGLVYLQKGLAPFVDREIYFKHAQFMSNFPPLVQRTCESCCTLENILPDHDVTFCKLPKCFCKKNTKRRRICPKNFCGKFCHMILDEHRTGDPLWTNSDMNAWPFDHWSIAKCYMTIPTHCNSSQTTDASGLLSVIINGKFFQRKVTSKLGQPGDVFLKARTMRNDIFQRAKMELTDAELQDVLDTFIAVLKDPASLLRDRDASLAVKQLESLKQSDVFVSPEEELEVLNMRKEAIKLVQEQQQKAVESVQTDKNAAIRELKNAAGKVEKDINELNEILKHTDMLIKKIQSVPIKMIFDESIIYQTFVVLLNQVGRVTLRKIIEKALNKLNTTQSAFLLSVKSLLIKSKELTKEHKEVLFPSSSADPDIKDFDVTLLSFIIVNCFKEDILAADERKAAIQIRDLQHRYDAHGSVPVMSTEIFTKELMNLFRITCTVAHLMPDKDKQQLLDEVEKEIRRQFNEKTAVEVLKRVNILNDLEESNKRELEEPITEQKILTTAFENVKTEHKHKFNRMEESKQAKVDENLSQLREEVVKIYAMLKDRGEPTNVKSVIYGKAGANAEDKETEEGAESLLLETGREYLAGSIGSKTSLSELIKKFESFKSDIEKRGTKLTGIMEGSVVFEFECPSLDKLIDLLDYFGSSDCQAKLGDIAVALTQVFSKKIHLSASIDPESLQDVVKKLRHMENEKTVQFEMECSGVDGLLHVLDLFGGNTATESLNELSKALSDTIKKPVTLYTSIDIDHMKSAIDSLKVHIAEEDAKESERRNQDCCQPSLDEDITGSAVCFLEKQEWILDNDVQWQECITKYNPDEKGLAETLLELKNIPSEVMLNKLVQHFGRKTELTSTICDSICSYIKTKSVNIVDVWAAFQPGTDSLVFIIILNKLVEINIEYKHIKRLLGTERSESKDITYSKVFDTALSELSSDEKEKMRMCINLVNAVLMKKHKYLLMMSASPVRSRGYGTSTYELKKETCIVLYVLVKGYIPIQEEPFKESYEGLPVDVRESFFQLFTGTAEDYQEHMTHGCQIFRHQLGTLGGFLDHHEYGICGITCGHVLLSPNEMKNLNTNAMDTEEHASGPNEMKNLNTNAMDTEENASGPNEMKNLNTNAMDTEENASSPNEMKNLNTNAMDTEENASGECVYQPDRKNVERNYVGKLVKAVYKKGGEGESGVEVAIFQIEQRFPEVGDFPLSRDLTPSSLSYDSGNILKCNTTDREVDVHKFGAATDYTSGKAVLDLATLSVKTYQDNTGYDILLHNLIEIKKSDVKEPPFARKGDSGALVFFQNRNNDLYCVGIVEGGTEHQTCVAVPIEPILKETGVQKFKSFMRNRLSQSLENKINRLESKIDALEHKMLQNFQLILQKPDGSGNVRGSGNTGQ